MTCFWNGILSILPLGHINKTLKINLDIKPSPNDFVILLKNNAIMSVDVKWNNEPLTQKLMEENLEWVSNYKVECIYQGHDCSTCDPFLLLISQLFCVDIQHNYNGKYITYTNSKNLNGLILNFMSNTGHFW
jgi:hypothetical protein